MAFRAAVPASRLHAPQLVYWGAQAYSQAPLLPWDALAPATESEAYLNGRRLLVLLDSGAFESTVDDRFASGLGVHAPAEPGAAESVHGFKRAGAESWIGDFDGFALGDEKVGHVRLRVLDLIGGYKYEDTGTRIAESAAAEDNPGMLIGADFLHAHRVFVDVKDRLILFTYEGGPVFAPPEAATAAAK